MNIYDRNLWTFQPKHFGTFWTIKSFYEKDTSVPGRDASAPCQIKISLAISVPPKRYFVTIIQRKKKN